MRTELALLLELAPRTREPVMRAGSRMYRGISRRGESHVHAAVELNMPILLRVCISVLNKRQTTTQREAMGRGCFRLILRPLTLLLRPRHLSEFVHILGSLRSEANIL